MPNLSYNRHLLVSLSNTQIHLKILRIIHESQSKKFQNLKLQSIQINNYLIFK